MTATAPTARFSLIAHKTMRIVMTDVRAEVVQRFLSNRIDQSRYSVVGSDGTNARGDEWMTAQAAAPAQTTALVYGISRWTSANRGAARHIDNGHGLPLCGGNGRKAFTWERETGTPTCKRCQRIAATVGKASAA